MLVLVPSHDDAAALREALPGLCAEARKAAARVVVVADRCGDDTAAVAREAGAQCLEKGPGEPGAGKGAALAWALSRLPDDGPAPRWVAVFDADSRPSPGFFAAACAPGGAALRARQAEVVPLPQKALLSRLAAYSEIVSQRVVGRLRTRLSWGIPLRGTGMVIERALLAQMLPLCATQVEDLELTLLLAARGVRIHPLPACVEDPKPATARGIAAQRARWLAGNFAALWARRREVARLAGSLEGATLVLWLFARPKSLLFSARFLVLAALLAVDPWGAGWTLLEWLLAIFLVKDLALLFGGLAATDRPRFYIPAVLCAPVYPLMWLASAARSLRARRTWLSARKSA